MLCNNPFGDLCSNNNKPFGDLRSYHFSFLRVTFSKRYFNVRLGFGIVAVDILLLPPAYVVCGEVIFSVMSVSQPFCLQWKGSHVTTTHDALGPPPILLPLPHGPIQKFSLVPPSSSPCRMGIPALPPRREVGLRLKGLLVFCFVLLSHEWEDRTFRTTPKKKHPNVLTDKSSFLKGFQSKFLLLVHSIVGSKKRKKIDDGWMVAADICRRIKLPTKAERLQENNKLCRM